MRLGDFRKETKDLPDDYILDAVMYIIPLPGYYDGRPYEYKDHNIIYTDEPKIRFYMLDFLDQFWDVCDADLSYEQNKSNYMSKFIKGKHIDDKRWEYMISARTKEFDDNWNSKEWQDFMKEYSNECL
jgi:hypothetical protein